MKTKPQTISRICDAFCWSRESSSLQKSLASITRLHRSRRLPENTQDHGHTPVYPRRLHRPPYLGSHFIFPGTLRILSRRVLPDEFPAHPELKMNATHIMWWELFPTLDHVISEARGGGDDDSNLVTTPRCCETARNPTDPGRTWVASLASRRFCPGGRAPPVVLRICPLNTMHRTSQTVTLLEAGIL